MLETFVHWGWGQTCTDSVDRATALEAGTQRNPLTDPQAKGSRVATVPGGKGAEGTQPAFDKVTEPMAASCAERVRAAPRHGVAAELQRQGDQSDPSKQGDVHVCN